MCFTNGKGSTKESALASALGEFIERLNCNFFYNDQFGEDIATRICAFPGWKMVRSQSKCRNCQKKFDEYTLDIYNPEDELLGTHLYDTNSGN